MAEGEGRKKKRCETTKKVRRGTRGGQGQIVREKKNEQASAYLLVLQPGNVDFTGYLLYRCSRLACEQFPT